MNKCPHCKKEITYLIENRVEHTQYKVSVDDNIVDYEKYDVACCDSEYCCPLCSAEIYVEDNEDIIIDFLNGAI